MYFYEIALLLDYNIPAVFVDRNSLYFILQNQDGSGVVWYHSIMDDFQLLPVQFGNVLILWYFVGVFFVLFRFCFPLVGGSFLWYFFVLWFVSIWVIFVFVSFFFFLDLYFPFVFVSYRPIGKFKYCYFPLNARSVIGQECIYFNWTKGDEWRVSMHDQWCATNDFKMKNNE